jgi:DNA-binding response OmpR family regulator
MGSLIKNYKREKTMESKKNIIVVDDDEELGIFLKMELELEGFEVEVCKDGLQGLNRIRLANPDLVICDWEMPKMTGIEVVAKIRETSEVPILMLTAKSSVKDRVSGINTGANDYLVKPFEFDELVARVRSLLRFSKAPPKPLNNVLDARGNLEWLT